MIEKNIRLQPHHSRDLLVGRRSDGRRPGYQPPGHGTGGGRGRDNGGGGGPPGGGDRQMTYSAPAPSPHRDPAPAPAPDRQDRAREQAAIEQAAREVEAREVAREKAIQVAALTTKTPTRSPHKDTQEQIIEQKILDDYGYQDKKAKAPTTLIPNVPYDRQVVWTGSPHGEHETGLRPTIVSNKYSPTYYQDKFGTRDRGSGIMGTVKDKSIQMAKNLAQQKTMQALGLAKYNPYLGIGSWLLDKFAPGAKAKLTSKFKYTGPKTDTQEDATEKLVKHEPVDRDEQQTATVQEAVAGKKPLGIDFEDIRKKQSTMKNALDEGWYLDNEGRKIQLTDQQKMMLTNYITQIDKYLVDPRAMSAYGGRIDKALGGRSRDIG